jgi:arylsulfatase A-like enzyme
MAEMIDYFPTLAELCHVQGPEALAGVSLVPVLNDVSARPRADALTQYANGYSLRTPRFRYTEWGEEGALGNELYDHASDPAEMVNLAGRPEQAETPAPSTEGYIHHGRSESCNPHQRRESPECPDHISTSHGCRS